MANELTTFENRAAMQLKEMANLLIQKKKLEETEKSLKKVLKNLMDECGIKNITTPVLKITSIGESESKSIDLKAFQEKEPVAYAELLEDYPKVTKRAGYVKFEVI